MLRGHCLVEQVTRTTVGIALLVVAALFFILGFSVLPVTGVILAIPPLLTGIIFLASPKSRSCYRKQ
jgi:NhaP-type Na+/H+ and K+/H+ antiporter